MRKYGIYKQSLIVKIAKAVKRKNNELKKTGETSGNVDIVFNGEIVTIDGTDVVINFPETCDAFEIVYKARQQSKCLTKTKIDGNDITITVYKPVCPEFIMLQRMLQKYAKLDLAWDDLYTFYISEDGQYIFDYVCHNEIQCAFVCAFLQSNRSAKDIMHASIEEVSKGDKCGKVLVIDIETPAGYRKVSKAF